MTEFDKLVDIIIRLRGENGCSWDKEQTLKSMVECLIEETYEVVESIDQDNNHDMQEEFGDLLFLTAFISRIAKEEGRFSMNAVLQGVSDKLIRRHPHVFTDNKESDVDVILKNWEKIKSAEKKNKKRQTPFDGIPKGLPDIQRFFKILEKIRREKNTIPGIQEAEAERSFELFLNKPNEESTEAFLENFLIYCFNNKIDISKAVRDLSQKTIDEYLKINS